MKKWNPLLPVIAVLLVVDIALRLTGGSATSMALAQTGPDRRPVELAMARSDSGNSFVLYRMWSDGSIDVRLVNPFTTQAQDWPNSDRAGLSFQEGWKQFQVGP
jgi:hypothetical protein